VQWTSVLIDSHIILLKAKHGTIEEATSAIESSLYHRRNNKNYNEGDMHSWQRYTRNIPLQTKVSCIYLLLLFSYSILVCVCVVIVYIVAFANRFS
jgi:hypothetical protein